MCTFGSGLLLEGTEGLQNSHSCSRSNVQTNPQREAFKHGSKAAILLHVRLVTKLRLSRRISLVNIYSTNSNLNFDCPRSVDPPNLLLILLFFFFNHMTFLKYDLILVHFQYWHEQEKLHLNSLELHDDDDCQLSVERPSVEKVMLVAHTWAVS